MSDDIDSVSSWLASDEAEYLADATFFFDGNMAC